MSLYPSTYRHWGGQSLGIWFRRWVIAENTLEACWRNKWARYFLLAAWGISLVQVAVLFALGQLLVEDSFIYSLVEQLQPQIRLFVSGLVQWLVEHPEISVRTTHGLLFYFYASQLRLFSMVLIGLCLPHLISRDLGSRAVIIYSSKAISRFDYFLGKFAAIFSLLSLSWLLPVVTAWTLGNLLAPDWGFFWHSRTALLQSVIYIGGASLLLSILALGISSVTAKERSAMAFWFVFWFVGNAFRGISEFTRDWLRHVSLTYNLDQWALYIFSPQHEIGLLRDHVPVFGEMIGAISQSKLPFLRAPEMPGVWVAVAIGMLVSVVIFERKVRPE